tara:strand:+ start:12568 stop:13968 length:1401 start_codon:yes stop_codon:yes gene_type:complete
MTLIEPAYGAFTESPNEIMYDIRKPVFVDNALHLGKYDSQKAALPKVSFTSTPYTLATEKKYNVVEEQTSMLLSHNKTHGHSSEVNVYTPSGVNTTSRLLYDSNDVSKRLYRDNVDNLSKKIRLNLSNMDNQTFTDLELGNTFHLGQPIDVGLRTSDLVMNLGSEVDGIVSSISIGESMTVTNAYSQRRKHSHTFSAFNFNNFNLMVALKILSRRDNRVLIFDNFGNLLFVPFNYSKQHHIVNNNLRFGSENNNPIDDTLNRVTMKGSSIALNDTNIITLNDGERQTGRFDVSVIENSRPIVDLSLIGKNEVTRAARQILKANNLMSQSLSTEGHPDLWYLRPGDVVMYGENKYVIMEAQHSLTDRMSNFKFLSLQAGVETVLQSIEENAVSSINVKSENLKEQIIKENLNFFNEVTITTRVNVITNVVIDDGLILGGNSNRVGLGATAKTIGMNKSTPSVAIGDA